MVLAMGFADFFCMGAIMFFLEPVDMSPFILDISSVRHFDVVLPTSSASDAKS
jgi:hypothetical protein